MRIWTLSPYEYNTKHNFNKKQKISSQINYTDNFTSRYNNNFITFTGPSTYGDHSETVSNILIDIGEGPRDINYLKKIVMLKKPQIEAVLDNQFKDDKSGSKAIRLALGLYPNLPGEMCKESVIKDKIGPNAHKGRTFDEFFEEKIKKFQRGMYPDRDLIVEKSKKIKPPKHTFIAAKIDVLSTILKGIENNPDLYNKLNNIEKPEELKNFLATEKLSNNKTIKKSLEDIFLKFPDGDIRKLREIDEKLNITKNLLKEDKKDISLTQSMIKDNQNKIDLIMIRRIFEHNFGLFGKEIKTVNEIKEITTFKNNHNKYDKLLGIGIKIVRDSLKKKTIIDTIKGLAKYLS